MQVEILDHTADFGFRVRAKDFGELIRNATLAMVKVWFGKFEASGERVICEIQVSGADLEQALIKYLNEVIFLIDSKRLIPVDVSCNLRETPQEVKLNCTIHGVDLASSKLRAIKPIKAATYHQLTIQKEPYGLIAEIFFDI